MIQHDEHAFYDRFLAPYPFFLGMIASFAACCVSGVLVSRHNSYRDFERFHDHINIGTMYYPTASQVRALAKSRLDPDKIIVVIGGSSIMHGSFQHRDRVWTKELQALLGDQYQVINFAMPGSHLVEFGGTAAEILSRDFPRLIFIADPGPACPCPDPDGYRFYKYFFWDAYYKGLLADDPQREERLAELDEERNNNDKFAELKLQMQLDRCFYFGDLWTTIAYRRVSTIWNPIVGRTFLKARKYYADTSGTHSCPLEKRYPARDQDFSMLILRGWIHNSRHWTVAPVPRHPARKAPGSEVHYATNLERSVKLAFPEPFRKRTLFTLVHESPHYTDQLASHEKAAYCALFSAVKEVVEPAGFSTVEIGEDYEAADYLDRCHLSEEGGNRMAHELAPQIRGLAARLGYLKHGDSP